jgi:DNA helicase II / ATP-dependent DNA helicase PcrA
MSDNLLECLNEEQLAAVTHGEGPLIIVAGAGTGKTTVATQRIAWLIEQGKAKPDEVLALTFTEKAATEMEERVDRLLPIGYVDLWISTFHAFCERILKANALEIGLPHEFKLLTTIDTLLLLRKNIDRFDLDHYKPRGNPTRFLKALMQHVSRAKDELATPERYATLAESLDDEDESKRIAELGAAYATYQEILLDHSALDFGDLIFYTHELLSKRPGILKQYQEQFKYILVDEFQDTNTAQYELVKLLAGAHGNITVVGDDDQSIYKFRGASISNIMQFRKDFPSAKSVVLTQNYRSTPAVLKHSYQLIQQNNPHRLEVQENINKELQSNTDGDGFVHHIHASHRDEEVNETVRTIIELQQQHQCNWSDFAILVRANGSAESFVDALDRAGIPLRFMAMSGLYTKPLILDARAYLRTIDQPHESPSLYRILSHPVLGITETDISSLTLHCRKKGLSLFDAMRGSDALDLTDGSHERIREILLTLSDLTAKSRRLPVSELFVEVAKASGLYGLILQQPEILQVEQFGLLRQFHERLKSFELSNEDKSLHHFLEEFDHERDAGEVGSLKTDIEEGPDVVQIMTVHASKGLEFRFVFIVNLVEQRFPSTRRADAIPLPDAFSPTDQDVSAEHISEERRLFYVALTRAKEGAYLLSAEDYGGARKRKASRFIAELDLGGILNKQLEKASDDAFADKPKKKERDQTLNYTLPNAMSFTQLAAFSSCPLQYKFAHILKVPVFGRHSLSFGKSLHNTLERFTEEMLASDNTIVQDLKRLKAYYDEQWIDEWYPDDATRVEHHEKGWNALKMVHADFTKKAPKIAFIEKGFTIKFKDIVFRGRIDRIDEVEGGYEIVDYKTGKPKEKLTWQDKRQLVLYQLAAEQCFDPPLKITRLTYHYLEDNSYVSFEAKEKDKEKLEYEILDAYDTLKKSDFSAKPGFHCQYCDFKDICEFAQK